MNHLLVRTKGKNGDFFKIISNKLIYDVPDDLNNGKGYNSDYKLEEDEWFVIEDFSEKEYCIDFLRTRFLSTDYNQLKGNNYLNIEYLCAYQTGIYLFQKLYPSQIIRKKYVSISEEPNLVSNMPIIILNPVPDAIYIKDNDRLYFKKLISIATIFKGIYELYKEATQEETENFLNNDFIVYNPE